MTKQYEIEEKLNRLVKYINDFTTDYGYPPSIREICAELNIPSTASAHYYIDKLSKEGRIKKSPSKNRAIGIIEPKKSYKENTLINLVGNVHAGGLHLVLEDIEDTYTVSPNLISGSSEQFMLKVSGNSMIDAGIFDGDKVIIKKQSTAENGDIVVALVGDEATVKRFYKKSDYIILHPENSTMKDIIVDDITILGVVVGLFRNL